MVRGKMWAHVPGHLGQRIASFRRIRWAPSPLYAADVENCSPEQVRMVAGLGRQVILVKTKSTHVGVVNAATSEMIYEWGGDSSEDCRCVSRTANGNLVIVALHSWLEIREPTCGAPQKTILTQDSPSSRITNVTVWSPRNGLDEYIIATTARRFSVYALSDGSLCGQFPVPLISMNLKQVTSEGHMLMEFDSGFGFQVSRVTLDSQSRQVQHSFMYGVGLETRSCNAICNETQVLAGGWNSNYFQVSIYRLVDGVYLGRWRSGWFFTFMPYSTVRSLCVTPSNHLVVLYEQTCWPHGRSLTFTAWTCQ